MASKPTLTERRALRNLIRCAVVVDGLRATDKGVSWLTGFKNLRAAIKAGREALR